MQLIARIDAYGDAYVGRFGIDDAWVKLENQQPVTVVRNEDYGQNVSVEDIEYARANHKIQNGRVFFKNEEVQDFYNGNQ
jgi:hypothetical protein